MKNPLKLLKSLVKFIYYPCLKVVIVHFDKHSKRIACELFFSQLKQHGRDCSIQWPIHVSGHNKIILGDDVSINAFTHMWGEGGITIGSRVMIASHTAITSLTHDYSERCMIKTVVAGHVNIGDDVWIGAHSVIVPGITIGEGAVIGAGSVVTNDVAPYTVVAGVPARILKHRVIRGE